MSDSISLPLPGQTEIQALPPGGATVVSRVANLIEAGRLMRWERFRFKLGLQDHLALELLILMIFDAGRESKFVPNPQGALAKLVGMDESDFGKAIRRLKSYGIVALKVEKDGTEYFIDPDSSHWSPVIRLRERADMLTDISSVENSKMQLPLWPAEQISEVTARMGLERVVTESQKQIGAERPANVGQVSLGGNSPDPDGAGKRASSGVRESPQTLPGNHAGTRYQSGEIPGSPFKSEKVHSSGGNHSFNSSEALEASSLKRPLGLSPEIRELRQRVLAVLSDADRSNWGGRWTNLVRKFPEQVATVLADYLEEKGRADARLRAPIRSAGGYMMDALERRWPKVPEFQAKGRSEEVV